MRAPSFLFFIFFLQSDESPIYAWIPIRKIKYKIHDFHKWRQLKLRVGFIPFPHKGEFLKGKTAILEKNI